MTKSESLTETQATSLRNLIKAGGEVSDCTSAFQAIGFDGRTLGALVRKGFVQVNHPDDRNAWTISAV
jgi:hypothetical protein